MLSSPNDSPDSFSGPRGLATAIGCFAAWWLAILPSIWTTRFGVAKAVRYKLAGMRRAVMPRKSRPHEGWRGYLPILGLGLALIIAVWALQGRVSSSHWHALFTALVGMAAGGAIVWGVRIIGSHALRKEAMGFGDVTLVAMIGVYLGWQPCLMLFFIAPFIGVVIALLNMLLRGQADIWYGPFLCAAALIVIVFWAKLWHDFGAIFTMGLFVPALVVIMFALMWAMLIFWRFIKEQIIFRNSPE